MKTNYFGNCELFAIFTIAVTILWVVIGKKWTLQKLAWAMFFPGLFAPWFFHGYDLSALIGYDSIGLASLYSFIAFLIVIGEMILCISFNILSGLGELRDDASWSKLFKSLRQTTVNEYIKNFLRASGEEIGWRCLMLPCLINKYGRFEALLISGLVWGCYHIPIMVLLTARFRTSKPYLTILFQFLSCNVNGLTLGWIAIQSNYSIWAPALLHFLWNVLNPPILGDVYRNRIGFIQGEVWKVNGEGLAGCMVGIVSYIFLANS
ncbi:DgyrCDS5928 [Dimorphilus gyrociliatus]|uniref:DgyrCDS5928 n=1 Tax=Dimorphilus gyrociliatus TaxID=2664684 RepID=A0A7I8VM76_9ANNE|nr:DgyrCDS5928 [Dimorphilus gyrociliatus]